MRCFQKIRNLTIITRTIDTTLQLSTIPVTTRTEAIINHTTVITYQVTSITSPDKHLTGLYYTLYTHRKIPDFP